jgi:ribose/xylose/arabinose/galactoside ABC-type transport system permease subunit
VAFCASAAAAAAFCASADFCEEAASAAAELLLTRALQEKIAAMVIGGSESFRRIVWLIGCWLVEASHNTIHDLRYKIESKLSV